MTYELRGMYEDAGVVFVPKGKNREPITGALQEAGIDVPEFNGRRLTEYADGKDWMLARDADMATCLEGRPDGLGFMGTDTWGEMSEEERAGFSFLAITDIDVRFALLTTEEKAEALEGKLERGEAVNIASTFPRGATVAIGGLMGRLAGEEPRISVMNIDGSIEGAPRIFPQVDGVYDIVESGRTARENGLLIVQDDLATVSLGAIAASGL